MQAFGVGSFHFSIDFSKAPENLTIDMFVNEIGRVLESIQSVSDLEVDYDEDMTPPDAIINSDFFEQHDCAPDAIFPFIHFFEVNFTLTLLKTYQRKLLGYSSVNDESTSTDLFDVNINYDYQTSLAIVKIANSNRKSSGANAIQVVREYLAAEFKVANTFVTFEFLGPSPFHANFYISHDDSLNSYKVNLIEDVGYDDIEIILGKDDGSSGLSQESRFMIDFKSELDTFYGCVTARNWFMHRWYAIREGINELEKYQNRRFSPFFYFQKRKLISNILLELWMFNNDKIDSENEISSYHTKFPYHRDGVIKNFIDKEIKNSPKYSIKETIELVQFFEQKNAKSFELGMALITSIIGGVIGAVITSLSSLTK
ncbi:hypothetical protein [Enterobacter asburiae]|uniref:hypothetical protein n=1 Tax=Enterobacter asburiae TaxID=61645 RepID=UPI002FF8ADCA